MLIRKFFINVYRSSNEIKVVLTSLRVQVSDYVTDRIVALRSQQPGQFNNVACLRLGQYSLC